MSEESNPPQGEPEEAPQGWAWTLFTGISESAVEVWRDGELKLTLPLTDDQAELLMGRPVTLTGELERDGFAVGEDGTLSVTDAGRQPAPDHRALLDKATTALADTSIPGNVTLAEQLRADGRLEAL